MKNLNTSKGSQRRAGERGGTLIEFTAVAVTFLMMVVGIVSAGNLFFTHNALAEATRRGARYAVLHPTGSTTAVRNVVIYGTDAPAPGAGSLIYNLQPGNVIVSYSGMNIAQGTVSVTIQNYVFPFVIPSRTTSIQMPPYRTTLTGECSGFIPPNM